VDEALLRGSIWLSLVAWSAAEWLRLSSPTRAAAAARLLWTAGALLAASHVAAAFQLRHGWSQARAFEETARQTEELLGFRFGGGLYVNYAFLAVWLGDASWWWLRPASFAARPRALDAAIRLFLLFIFVNGAIVFASGPVRLLGGVAVVALAAAWYLGRRVGRK
jgi:hypothetical protein